MVKIYQFPVKNRKAAGLHELFSQEEIELYYRYFKESDNWQHEGKPNTMYDGYPAQMACHPFRSDMVWYIDEQLGFGTWVINHSKKEISVNSDLVWGWHPFVRRSTAPVHEPLNLTQREMRNHVAWIVDEDGYGQYGLVTNKGQMWVPHMRPEHWMDHNEAFGN